MKVFTTILFSLFVDIFFIIVGGFVLQHLWAWFIVPGFGFAELSLGAAVGIVLVVGLVATRGSKLGDDETLGEMLKRVIIERTIRMTVYMVFGAILAAILF